MTAELLETNSIVTTTISTPLGTMLAGASGRGIVLLEFTGENSGSSHIKRLQKRLKTTIITDTHRLFLPLERQLTEYFEGRRQHFDIPLDVQGTDFQKKVWGVLQAIPYGQTRSYQEQSDVLGNPKAIRAAARANGANFISIIIPCHRIIGKKGSLTGYSGGLWRKEYLLNLEKKYR